MSADITRSTSDLTRIGLIHELRNVDTRARMEMILAVALEWDRATRLDYPAPRKYWTYAKAGQVPGYVSRPINQREDRA